MTALWLAFGLALFGVCAWRAPMVGPEEEL